MSTEKNIYQRLLDVQREAVAPREISGKFGKARSAEQILEAYKPVCNKHGLYLFTSDDVHQVGERNYVTSTATVVNTDKPEEKHSASASAWENEVERNKYGAAILDTSQVSGKTSSYAKKYALQNLFAIDDTKDADHDEQPTVKATRAPLSPQMTTTKISAELTKMGFDADQRKQIVHGITDTELHSKLTAQMLQNVLKKVQLANADDLRIFLTDAEGGAS